MNTRKIMAGIVLLTILTAAVAAQNDPGHDTLYIEEEGDSELNGTFNVTLNQTIKGGELDLSEVFKIRGNGDDGNGSLNYLVSESGGDVSINTKGATSQKILLQDQVDGGMVQIGDGSSISADLNVSNNFYLLGNNMEMGNNFLLNNNGNVPNETGRLALVVNGTDANSGSMWLNTKNLVIGKGITGAMVFLGKSSQNDEVALNVTDTIYGQKGINVSSASYIGNSRICTPSNGLCGSSNEGNVSGNGTANTIPKWTGNTTLGDSQITDDGTTVTITDNLGFDTGTTVNEISTSTSLGTSDNILPTQNAVKTYVDNNAGGGDTLWTNSSGNATYTAGNVGIGTTSPTRPLHVNDSGNLKIQVETSSASSHAQLQFTKPGQAWSTGVDTTNNRYIIYGSEGASRALIVENGTGNIGIGANPPTTKLDVDGNARIRTLTNCDTIDTDSNGNLQCGTDDGGSGVSTAAGWTNTSTTVSLSDPADHVDANTLYINNTQGSVILGTDPGGTGLLRLNGKINLDFDNTIDWGDGGRTITGASSGSDGLIMTSKSAMNFIMDSDANSGSTTMQWMKDGTTVSGSTPLMALTENAEVGIGTDNPERPLHISSSPPVLLLENTGGATNDKRMQLHVNGGQAEFNSRNDDNTARVDDILVMDMGNGNVGIGTNSPANQLDVDGGINANTLNTGQGDNELYDMDQNVQTSDSPTFSGMDLTGNLDMNGNLIQRPSLPTAGKGDAYNSWLGLERNHLFRADQRSGYTVTTSGNAGDISTSVPFDGIANGVATSGDCTSSSPCSWTVEFSNTWFRGFAVGFTSRYWQPVDFTFEMYNTDTASWDTVASETGWSGGGYLKDLSGTSDDYSRFRFTVTQTTSDNKVQIGELFLLRAENAPYEGLYAKTVGANFYGNVDMNGNNLNNVGTLGDVDSTSHVNNLNADLLDGNHATGVAQMQSATNVNGGNLSALNDGWYEWRGTQPVEGSPGHNYMAMLQADHNQKIQLAFGGSGYGKLFIRRADNGNFYPWTEFWSESNDGSNSGLDADKLDNIDSTGFCQSDGTNCPSDDTGTDDQTLSEVLSQGNNAGTNNIVMDGNDITQANQIQFNGDSGTNVYSLGEGGFETNDFTMEATQRDMYFSVYSTGSGDDMHFYTTDGGGTKTERMKIDSNINTATIDIFNSNLDMNGNNINNVGTLGDVDSTSHVNNLNADLLDGNHASAFMDAGTDNWVNEGGDTMTGDLSIDDGGGALKLREGGADHTYMEFYADSASPGTRSAWFGYGSGGSTTLTLNNQISSAVSIPEDVAVNTLDTGQGNNELYAMDQNVRTSDSVTFNSIDLNSGSNVDDDRAILDTGYIEFVNKEGNDILAQDGVMYWDASEGWQGYDGGAHRTFITNYQSETEHLTVRLQTLKTTDLEDEDATNFFDGSCSDNQHITGIDRTGSITCGSDSGDISQVSSGTGTKGGSTTGSATIEFDCSEVQGNEITCSGETIGVDEGSGSDLDADLLDNLDSTDLVRMDGHTSYHAANDLISGWYTIATVDTGRAVARFGLRDTDGGDHQSVVFYGAHHYGRDASNTLTVLDNSRFSGSPYRYIRIKDAGTYCGAAIQVYIDKNDNNLRAYKLGDDFQAQGWDIKDFVPDGTDPGGVTTHGSCSATWNDFTEASRVDLDQIDQGGLATTGEIYAGGDTTQYKVWHENNDGSTSGLDADKLDNIDSTGFCQSDGTNCPADNDHHDDPGDHAATSTVDISDEHVNNVREIEMQDWDSDAGGSDNSVRLLRRDDNWMFYNGGFVIGSYADAALGDIGDGNLLTEGDINIAGGNLYDGTGTSNFFEVSCSDDQTITNINSAGSATCTSIDSADRVDGLHAGSFIRSDTNDNVNANTEWQDSQEVRFGNSADWRIDWVSGGPYLRIRGYNHGSQIRIQGEDGGGTNEPMIYADPDSWTRLYYNGGLKFETTNYGANVNGDLELEGNDIRDSGSTNRISFSSGDVIITVG